MINTNDCCMPAAGHTFDGAKVCKTPCRRELASMLEQLGGASLRRVFMFGVIYLKEKKMKKKQFQCNEVEPL